jgi:hypothetical protein
MSNAGRRTETHTQSYSNAIEFSEDSPSPGFKHLVEKKYVVQWEKHLGIPF